jgi:hypothetical protein
MPSCRSSITLAAKPVLHLGDTDREELGGEQAFRSSDCRWLVLGDVAAACYSF